MDHFPLIEPNQQSIFGPILVMDRGFGKLRLVKAFCLKNYKILCIAATAGSEHPIVPSSALAAYVEKLKLPRETKTDEFSEEKVSNCRSCWTIH